jgi:hypothetical protein
MLMRRKLLAVVSLVTILAMESVTVFATETGTGNGSPNSLTISGDYLDGNAGNTVETVVTTQEQVTTVQVTATAKIEVKETKTNNDGSKTTTLASDTKDTTTGVSKTFEVTEKTDGTLSVVSSTGAKNDFIETNKGTKGDTLIQCTTTRETATIKPSDDTKFNEFTNEVKLEVIAKSQDYKEKLEETTGATVESITAFDAQGGEVDEYGWWEVAWDEAVEGMSNVVLHKEGNDWKQVKSESKNGYLRVQSFTKSPFIVMKLDKNVSGITTTEVDTDYTQPNASLTNGATGTVSGATSPKTAEADPYAIIIALAAVICIIVCNKKIAEK